MKLTWHIIKKDLRRDHRALLLWALLYVAQVAIGFVLLRDSGEARDWIDKLQAASLVLTGLQFVLSYVLTARLVHADLLLGTDMFWVTRPISGRRLLLAKAGAVLLVFGLLPVLLRLPWWLACGFTARDILWTAVNTVGWQLLFVVPAFLVAALTNEFSRVLLWTILLFIAGLLGFGLLVSLLQSGRNADAVIDYAGTLYTRVWLSAVLAMILAGAVAAHHYCTRHLLRSIALTVAGLGVVAAAGTFVRVDWTRTLFELPQPPAPPEIAAALAAVQVEAGAALPNTSVKPRSGEEPALVTEIYFQGLPEELSVSSDLSRLRWQWLDGQGVNRTSYSSTAFFRAEPLLRRTYGLVKPAADPETVAWQKARKEEFAFRRQARGLPPPSARQLVPPTQPGQRSLVHARVPAALIQRAQAEPPAFTASLWCVASRPSILAELPLRAGAEGGAGSTRARLKWIGPESEGRLSASVLVTAPALKQSGLWLVNFLAPFRAYTRPNGEMWTVNRVTGDLERVGGYSLQAPRNALVAGVVLSWNRPLLHSGQVIREGRRVPRDPDWPEHTGLVLVDEEVVGRFPARVETARLEFRPSLWEEKPAEDETTGMAD